MKAQSSGEAALHMFSEHLFMRTPLECFNIILKKSSKVIAFLLVLIKDFPIVF